MLWCFILKHLSPAFCQKLEGINLWFSAEALIEMNRFCSPRDGHLWLTKETKQILNGGKAKFPNCPFKNEYNTSQKWGLWSVLASSCDPVADWFQTDTPLKVCARPFPLVLDDSSCIVGVTRIVSRSGNNSDFLQKDRPLSARERRRLKQSQEEILPSGKVVLFPSSIGGC